MAMGCLQYPHFIYFKFKKFFSFSISKDSVGKLLDTAIVHNDGIR